MQDGLAVERFDLPDGGGSAMLAVTLASRSRLTWQIMPPGRLGALAAAGLATRADSLPCAWVRISTTDGVQTNDIFRRVFAKEAAEILREQVDAGVFVAGRAVLPGADGRDRLALTAAVSERGTAGPDGPSEWHEIYLFVPDAETTSQVTAAETLEAIPVSLVQLDLEGRILWGNAQARDMLGSGFEAGKALDDLVQPLGRSGKAFSTRCARAGKRRVATWCACATQL